jgi:hypothetical protein
MILMSQNGLLDERDETALDAWYLEHLRSMSSVPGIYSAQRFKTSSPGFPRSLALYSVTSEKAFDTPYYRSVKGMGAMASRMDERQHHVDLFEGLDAAPVVSDDGRLLLADRAVPKGEIAGIAFSWLKCVARDFSTPYRGIAVVAADRLPALDPTIAVYSSVTDRLRGTP